tara:strand:- start:120 stop:317 length:198 start_codon:yes stop_codon:yes gene_type:complete
MKTFKKYWISDTIKTNGHWAVGTIWDIVGSKNNIYNIEMVDKGFTCSCPAFKKCKHITQVEEGFC